MINSKVGINIIQGIPKEIAKALNKNDIHFSGHCFRRSGASFLAEKNISNNLLKKAGRWKSDSVVMGYIDNSNSLKKTISSFFDNLEKKDVSSTSSSSTSSTLPISETSIKEMLELWRDDHRNWQNLNEMKEFEKKEFKNKEAEILEKNDVSSTSCSSTLPISETSMKSNLTMAEILDLWRDDHSNWYTLREMEKEKAFKENKGKTTLTKLKDLVKKKNLIKKKI
jgi:hypothetical protein